MTPENSSQTRFGDIALCLSGGGYRAAAYALGTIDMLDELDLRRDVKLFSTVSGGSFTGMTYAAWLGEGKTYGRFYGDFYNFLEKTNCIDKALDDLYDTPSPSGSTDLSLIRSAAKSYADSLFKDRTFKELQENAADGEPFRELIFNTTEFRRGNSFRFRASSNPDAFIGNQIFAVPPAVAAEVRLADIVAASSCFPGAFEPLRFPDDFHWTSTLENVREDLKKDVKNPVTGKTYKNGFNGADGDFVSVPLMDGGIYDNQGISSAVLADASRTFGLFLITDTSQRDEAILSFATSDARRGWLTMNTVFWFAVALFVSAIINVCLLAYYFLGAFYSHRTPWFELVLFFIAPVFFSLVNVGILIWLYRVFLQIKSITVAGAKFRIWYILKELTLPDFIELLKARFSSLSAMTGNVFMKHARQMEFNDIMSDPQRARLVSFNLIYDLNPSKSRADLWKLAPDLKPTDELVEISKTSEAMQTTLWIDKKDLDTLIVCGQATCCFSLLKYLWRRWQIESEEAQKSSLPEVPKPDNPASPFYEIYGKLLAKWLELKANPQVFLNRKRTEAEARA
ncbi:MAG TPA: patatin-like phospholipase family protein [Pyrinomonadaceae bacterium]|nr:patatin-like phospholipase family protein [Pyrinomonadaceae bacterium]